MTEFENKNDTQTEFNQVKGILVEVNPPTNSFGSITLEVGKTTKRMANLICKSDTLIGIKDKIRVGDLAMVTFYITSKFKNDRWYTIANVLQITKL
jgi:ABC-type transport system involved in Fe-S cluster assembly fused permease/ATPase subunit